MSKEIRDLQDVMAVLPTPEKLEPSPGSFVLRPHTQIVVGPGGRDAAIKLQDLLRRTCGMELQLQLEGAPVSGQLYVGLQDWGHGDQEGYQLHVSAGCLSIGARRAAGLFYGIQTLAQLLPSGEPAAARVLPSVHITDRPRHSWRAFMLDSGRQYQTPDFIRRYLDMLAALKINVFHWHLTEGLGWRVEIKRYPRLTDVGARVATGPQQQGFYTQDEIREIVAYAAQRHIRVIPEIDVPGHSTAALTAHPEFSCRGQAPGPERPGSHSPVIFCAGKEPVYSFLEHIIDEVCGLFPDEFIHLGGDEAPKDEWDQCPDCRRAIQDHGLSNSHQLQVHFSNRLAAMAAQRGKRVILWDDVVAQPGPALRADTVIHWWAQASRGDHGLRAGLAQGHDVLCTPNYYTYLNFPVQPWSIYKDNRTFDLPTAYLQNPADVDRITGLSDADRAHVLGIGAALWSDGNVRQEMVDRRVFPRLMALAELMWHRGERLDVSDLRQRAAACCRNLGGHAVDPGPATADEIDSSFSWE
jgi:hexosaminidase